MSGEVPTAKRSAPGRRRIADTTALSLFVQLPAMERSSGRGRGRGGKLTGRRNGSLRQAIHAAGNNICLEPIPRAQSTPIPSTAGAVGTSQLAATTLRRSPSELILKHGGLRLLSGMSAYMNSDDHIILADADSGMAALVLGVSKVSDNELATIAGKLHYRTWYR
jgi:hypothetical protein